MHLLLEQEKKKRKFWFINGHFMDLIFNEVMMKFYTC